ncbi:hypothetical protein [Thermoanaerobacter mathranii]|uniref:hypothetical protein n=1 Tax=Thermoanaerobacter mathranii TaxID=583357 RepID=UPI003AB0FF91
MIAFIVNLMASRRRVYRKMSEIRRIIKKLIDYKNFYNKIYRGWKSTSKESSS